MSTPVFLLYMLKCIFQSKVRLLQIALASSISFWMMLRGNFLPSGSMMGIKTLWQLL